MEASTTAFSPYHAAYGELFYFGPGNYFRADASDGVNLLTGEVDSAVELRATARDAAERIQGSLGLQVLSERDVLADSLIGPTKSGDLVPVKGSDVKSRVPSYGYITGSYVYPNEDGICGWVAGSILTRYWHARSSAKKLLPASYRNGTNMIAEPNFATYLQGSGGDSTWAPNVRSRLAWNANKQGVSYASSWALGQIGAMSQVRDGYPVLLFGSYPVGKKKKGGHAVVAYGETKSGHYITHYGWSGYTNIVLSEGTHGSNARFRLT